MRTVKTLDNLSASEPTYLKNRLKEALGNELPGEHAHRRMLPAGRELHPAAGQKNIIQSSVLILLFPDAGEISTCLIRRPTGMKNHAGQIAFPGGRFESTDKDLSQTALRESFEEIGVESNQVEIIGELTPIYVNVSNFTINPFIGWCETKPDFKADDREVDELFIVTMKKLLHPQTYQSKDVITPRGIIYAPGYLIDTMFIWGATAMILTEFNEIYSSAT